VIEDFSSQIAVAATPREYTFSETTSAFHTDIESGKLSAVLADFGRIGAPTTLQYSALGQDWLERASYRFQLIFGSVRNPAVLQFFSFADALSYRRAWYDTAASSTMPATITPVQHPSKINGVDDLSDPAVLPGQICDWLDITYGQLAIITGVSRASFFNWRQPGASPRPNGIQRVQRLHAMVSLLVRRFGVHGARTWLHSGDQPRWNRLMAGDLAAVEDTIRSQLFIQPATNNRHNELPLDEGSLDLPAASPDSKRVPRRAGRQPSRRQRGTSD
jgi:hypothetical protein